VHGKAPGDIPVQWVYGGAVLQQGVPEGALEEAQEVVPGAAGGAHQNTERASSIWRCSGSECAEWCNVVMPNQLGFSVQMRNYKYSHTYQLV
jgi:hypothetical protein